MSEILHFPGSHDAPHGIIKGGDVKPIDDDPYLSADEGALKDALEEQEDQYTEDDSRMLQELQDIPAGSHNAGFADDAQVIPLSPEDERERRIEDYMDKRGVSRAEAEQSI